jgi:hypothetical protein
MGPKKLEKLLIGEVSGVDDPANEIPGWMVMKSHRPSKKSRDELVAVLTPDERAGAAVMKHQGELRAGDHAAVEAVRKAAGSDDLALGVLSRFFKRVLPASERSALTRAVAEQETALGIARARGRGYARIL